MTQTSNDKKLKKEIDNYLRKIEQLLTNVQTHIRDDFVGELEEFLYNNYKDFAKDKDTSNEEENILLFIQSLESPKAVAEAFKRDNNIENSHSSLKNRIQDYFKFNLVKRPIKFIIATTMLNGFVFFTLFILSSFNNHDPNNYNPFLNVTIFILYFVILMLIFVLFIKNIPKENNELKIEVIPLFFTFSILPLFLIENLSLMINGMSVTDFVDKSSNLGVNLVFLPQTKPLFIDETINLFDFTKILLLVFSLTYLLSYGVFLIRKNFKMKTIPKQLHINAIVQALLILLIISISSPLIGLEAIFSPIPIREPGNFYYGSEYLQPTSLPEIEKYFINDSVLNNRIYTSSFSPNILMNIYELTQQGSNNQLANIGNPLESNLIQIDLLNWTLPFSSIKNLENYILNYNGTSMLITTQTNSNLTYQFTLDMKIIDNLYFEYGYDGTDYFIKVYSLSSFNLVFITSTVLPEVFGIRSFSNLVTNWYFWQINVYKTPYIYPIYYGLMNLVVLILEIGSIIIFSYYTQYVNKKSVEKNNGVMKL